MYFTSLPRALLAVSGPDAEAFLQGLISNDLRKLAPDALLYAAMLSPQGKFLHDFFLTRRGEAVLLDCDASRLDDLVKRLSLYKLRAQVTIERLPESEGVVAIWGEKNSSSPELPKAILGRSSTMDSPRIFSANSGNDGQMFLDPRLPEMGFRAVGNIKAIDELFITRGWQKKDFFDYEAHRLALGVPDTQDMIVDKSFLLESGFEALHGVDFNKGCYVGQEVTARSKFRGQVRKHLFQVRTGGEFPAPGTPVTLDGAEVGTLRSHAGPLGLAILRIEAVEKAQTEKMTLLADKTGLTATWPQWAQTHE